MVCRKIQRRGLPVSQCSALYGMSGRTRKRRCSLCRLPGWVGSYCLLPLSNAWSSPGSPQPSWGSIHLHLPHPDKGTRESTVLKKETELDRERGRYDSFWKHQRTSYTWGKEQTDGTVLDNSHTYTQTHTDTGAQSIPFQCFIMQRIFSLFLSAAWCFFSCVKEREAIPPVCCVRF